MSFDKTKELKEGTLVTINVPFEYYIGEESPLNSDILKTIENCENACREEVNNGIHDVLLGETKIS